ncbi:putative LRR receptor-like serine/threonine-protein kinase [Nymphaea thermarum]|nr:putative LRR receptor-like serine/threonine-protein kinase [Nymphaea thermarum]
MGTLWGLLQLFILSLLLAVPSAISGDPAPALNDDVLGLIVFKADLHDPSSALTSWAEDDDSPCNWAGVWCNPRTGRVTELVLEGLSLNGKIGRGLALLQSLRKLSLARNNLTGTISHDLALLKSLKVVDLSENRLSGSIPAEFFERCSSLRVLSLGHNAFEGQIPESLSSCLTLTELNLSSNFLSSELPDGIWSLTGLHTLDLSRNSLVGAIPPGVKALGYLHTLDLSGNRFSGSISDDIGECLTLRTLNLGDNGFSGVLPDSMQQLSALNSMRVHRNRLNGEIPSWIGGLKALGTLDISSNAFSGEIPDMIGELALLRRLNLSSNQLIGKIPDGLKNCQNLSHVDFSRNGLIGKVPSWMFGSGSLSSSRLSEMVKGEILPSAPGSGTVEFLDLSLNNLSGELPSEIGFSPKLAVLNVSGNSLGPNIPATIGELMVLQILDLSRNQFGGSIPSKLGKCSSVTTLSLSHNRLTGPIPSDLGNLSELQILDLSVNNLSGQIPQQLGNLSYLHFLNISGNNFQGDLPAFGIFAKLSPLDFAGNPSLCVSRLNKSCPPVLPKPIVLNPNSTSVSSSPASGTTTATSAIRHKKIILSISTLVAISAAAAIILGVIAVTVLNLRVRSSSPTFMHPPLDSLSGSPSTDGTVGAAGAYGKLIMFSGEGDFSAGAHALLNKDCELGRGGFGTVYRTVLRDGCPVAIKKLTVSSLVKSQEDFEKEVRKLGKIHHPNLVQLLGYYWTPQLQLLIYEYVSGGSLYTLLHEEQNGNCFTWSERFDIILGIAKGLEHLHQSCRPPMIHYNLKSSNILVDGRTRVAKVADFGLAKLLPMLDRYVLSSKIQSALGYMAPEFACRSVKINEKCDVYGFGVLVLEVVTGKRPVEYMEDDVVVLIDGVRRALDEGRIADWVDGRMGGKFPTEEVVPVVKLGLICTSQLPSNRPAMGEVVHILELIRGPADSREEL